MKLIKVCGLVLFVGVITALGAGLLFYGSWKTFDYPYRQSQEMIGALKDSRTRAALREWMNDKFPVKPSRVTAMTPYAAAIELPKPYGFDWSLLDIDPEWVDMMTISYEQGRDGGWQRIYFGIPRVGCAVAVSEDFGIYNQHIIFRVPGEPMAVYLHDE
jgi:hypothetical protein